MIESLAPTKQSLEAETQRWSVQAKTLPPIVDAESCTHASYLLRSVKGLRADIAKWFAPHLEAATETKRTAEAARKGLADEQAKLEAPLVLVEQTVKAALLAWETEQEAVRRAEERRLQALAQQEAETKVLEAAAEMERTGVQSGNAEMVQEAADILAQPIEAPIVSVKTLTPKVHGIVYRNNWKAHPDVDVRALAKAVGDGTIASSYLTPNMTALNQLARASEGGQKVPGVKFYNDRQIAARG